MSLFWEIFLIIAFVNCILFIIGEILYEKGKYDKDLTNVLRLLLPCQCVVLVWLFIFDLGFEWWWF